jgi:hypothetical protein
MLHDMTRVRLQRAAALVVLAQIQGIVQKHHGVIAEALSC